MSSTCNARRSRLLAVLLSLASGSQAAAAAEPAAARAGDLTEVVVTGSHIAGARQEDLAIPVDVITQEELQNRGSPSVLDLLKEIPAVGVTWGEADQGASPFLRGPVGAASVNLRGLGPLRTLTLFNGHRLTTAERVDANLLPLAAIGQVDVLKDGAAAIYGSDAIAGVVNFNTRRDLRGFDASADFRAVDGSSGDYGGALSWGWVGDNGNVLVSFGYRHRSVLKATDRDYGATPLTVNDSHYSGSANPGVFTVLTGAGGATARVQDGQAVNTCPTMGGTYTYAGTTPTCRLSFMLFQNLIEEEDYYQGYLEGNFRLGEDTNASFELLYSHTITPARNTSPGFFPLNGPTGPGTPFFIPRENPGFTTFLQQSGRADLIPTATGAFTSAWRPFGLGGVPLTGTGNQNRFESQFAMFSAGFDGKVGSSEVKYDVRATGSFHRYLADGDSPAAGFDILTDNLDRALRGFGGPKCTGTTPGANGCQWYNPFSNALAANPVLGLTNPNYVPALANSNDVSYWLYGRGDTPDQRTAYVVLDALFSGSTGLDLGGGPMMWAAGAQMRRSNYQLTTLPGGNVNTYPCAKPGDFTCFPRTGPYLFLGAVNPVEVSDSVYAVFGELSVPVTRDIDLQAAVRYEDYGGQTGSTTNPKLALRWQALPWLAVRGSVGTTFRGPTAEDRADSGVSNVFNLSIANNSWKAVDEFGNPAVGPEKALTWNVGALVQAGGFRGSIDYWSYDLEDQIVSPPSTAVANSVVPVPLAGGLGLVNCSAGTIGLVTLTRGSCVQGVTVANDIQRVLSRKTNGPDIKLSGIDVDARYDMDVLGGMLGFGGYATWMQKYELSAFQLGTVTVSAAYDAVGLANFTRLPGPMPELKGTLFAEYARGDHFLRLSQAYVDSYEDERTFLPRFVQIAPGPACTAPAANCSEYSQDRMVKAFYTTDVTYRWQVNEKVSLTAAMLNAFDKDPSFARVQPSYVPSMSSPYGRTFKVIVRTTF